MKDGPLGNDGNRGPRVVHEARSRRGLLRFTTPLEVTIDGRSLRASDWSLGGFSFVDDAAEWQGGRVLAARLTFPSNNLGVVFECRCAVTRVETGGRVGCRFLDLKPDQLEFLRSMVDAATTGTVANVESALSLSRQPAAHPGFMPPEGLAADGRRGWGKALGYALLVVVGLLLAVFVGLSLYGRLLIVKAEFAAVSGALLRVTAPRDGVVLGPLPMVGQPLAVGDPLFTLGNQELDTEIRLAEAAMVRQEAEVASLRRRHRQAVDFLALYAGLAEAALARAKAELAGAEAAREASGREAARVAALHGSGFASNAAMEAARKRRLETESAVDAARAAVTAASTNAAIARDGRFFTGSRIEGREPSEVAEDLAVAEAQLAYLRVRRDALGEQRVRLQVTSPCVCAVDAALVGAGEWVKAGSPALLLASPAEDGGIVIAKVSLERAAKLSVGGRAEILLAAETAPRSGRIDRIVLNLPAGARPGLPAAVDLDPRYASVQVRLHAGGGPMPLGTPAQVVFPVDLADAFVAWMADR